MRVVERHTDLVKVLVAILAVLLMVGVLPFTHFVVGALLLLVTFELKLTWRKRY